MSWNSWKISVRTNMPEFKVGFMLNIKSYLFVEIIWVDIEIKLQSCNFVSVLCAQFFFLKFLSRNIAVIILKKRFKSDWITCMMFSLIHLYIFKHCANFFVVVIKDSWTSIARVYSIEFLIIYMFIQLMLDRIILCSI